MQWKIRLTVTVCAASMLRIDADGLDTGGEIATRAIEDHWISQDRTGQGRGRATHRSSSRVESWCAEEHQINKKKERSERVAVHAAAAAAAAVTQVANTCPPLLRTPNLNHAASDTPKSLLSLLVSFDFPFLFHFHFFLLIFGNIFVLF